MAGSHIRRLRGGPFAAALALFLCLFAGPALAQNPSPPVPPTGMPAQNLRSIRLNRNHAGNERRRR